MAREAGRKTRGRALRATGAAGILIGAVGAATGVFALAGQASADASDRATAEAERAAVAPLIVAAAPVRAGDSYTTEVRFAGEVRAARRSEVSFDLSGTIVELSVDDGDRVEGGATIARLDTQRLEARLAEARARRAQADADRVLAEQTIRRVRNALASGAVAEAEVEETERELAAANAAIAVAQAAIATVEVDIEKSALRAPFDAVVVRRRVDPGAVVTGGTTVMTLLDLKSPEARIGIPADIAEDLTPGVVYSIEVRGRRVEGTLVSILPSIDRGSRTAEAVFVLDAELNGLRDGDIARVSLERTMMSNGVEVSMDALVAGERGLFAVYVAEPLAASHVDGSDMATHVVNRRDVKVLAQSGDSAFVSGFIEAGELVVAEGVHKLVPGLRVRVTGN